MHLVLGDLKVISEKFFAFVNNSLKNDVSTA